MASGAAAADMESHVVARTAAELALPFAILRVIADPAERELPPAALAGMRADGGINVGAVLASLARSPRQLPALIRLAAEAGRARAALLRCQRSVSGRASASAISASFCSTCLENTYSAGRWRSSGMSGAIGPSVLMPARASFASFHGLLTASMTAVASKPLCTMQSAHFS